MKTMFVFLSVLLMSFSLSAECLDRTYTADHLKKYPNQEIRSLLMSYQHNYDADGNSFANIQINIKMIRQQKARIVELKARCPNMPFGYFDMMMYETPANISCSIDGSNKKIELKPLQNSEFNLNVTLDPQAELIDVMSKEKIKLKSGDNVFRLKNDSNLNYFACEPVLFRPHTVTSARLWSEAALQSVRYDLARPTVTSRNLYHLSILLWDIYASFSPDLKMYHLAERFSPSANANVESLRNEAMHFAAYTFIKARFKNAPGNVKDNRPSSEMSNGDQKPDELITRFTNKIMERLGYTVINSQPAATTPASRFGVRLAEQLLNDFVNDGSGESENYAHPKTYVMNNTYGYLDVMQSGVHTPGTLQTINNAAGSALYTTLTPGINFADSYDIDFWQPLYLPGSMDQNGNELDSPQAPLTLYWGQLKTFSDLSAHKSPSKPGVYFEDIAQPLHFKDNPDEFILQNLKVIEASGSLNPVDLVEHQKDFDNDGQYDQNKGAALIDISPRSMGNNALGSNNGKGYSLNPQTQKPYPAQMVKRADYYRALAEFWADGPRSETPPGHWNVIANTVIDDMQRLSIPFKWNGTGSALPREQYELMLHLTMNGALYDAGIVAWGLKGYYQGSRPLSVIRKLARWAEADPAFAQKLEQLSPLVKMVTFKQTDILHDGTYNEGTGEYGTKTEKTVTKMAVYGWRGPFTFGDIPNLRNTSFQRRNATAQDEDDFYGYNNNSSGVGWILAENWMPYQQQTFVTPPFPGFVSGHSTFSRAAAEVLAKVTGSEYFPGGLGQYPAPDLVFEYAEMNFDFQWAKFYDAADESGISRIYGGIHAPFDDVPGRKIGSRIGIKAFEKANSFFK